MAHAGATFLGGVLVGALAGGATAALVAGAGAPGDARPATEAQFEMLEQVLERAVTRAVREGRRADAPATEERASHGPGEAGPELPTAPLPQTEEAAPRAARARLPGEDDAVVRTRDPSTTLPPKRTERLAGLVVRSAEAQESRRLDWLLVGEDVVLREFGAPDAIEAMEGGVERWTYSTEQGDLLVDLRAGRVISLWGLADW